MPRVDPSPVYSSQISLTFLCSLIPTFFSGERDQLDEFISNCDYALSLSPEERLNIHFSGLYIPELLERPKIKFRYISLKIGLMLRQSY